MPSGHQAVQRAIPVLDDAGIIGSERDAQILLLHILDLPRHRLRDGLATELSDTQLAQFQIAVKARADRQPVSQIIGRRAFWRHDFRVTRDTLDPRPETELLVELALSAPFSAVLDLGTGTGAILISILAERPGARGLGADLSPAALDVARSNARQIGVSADFAVSDWYSAVQGQFDLIVSNPPYIALSEMPSLSPEVREWEPRMALTDEGDGLTAYRAICAGAGMHLAPGGRLVVEIGPTQGQAVTALMLAAGLVDVTVCQDLGRRDRAVWGRNPVINTL